MKKTVVIIAFCMITISPLANAGLGMNFEDIKTASIVSDAAHMVSCYLSIPSDIDRIIQPSPPISVHFYEESDGLDWYYVYYTNPLADPVAGTLATVTLTGPEFFSMDPLIVGELTVWDETGTTPLVMTPIAVPEPATLALMAAGMLVLRRRK